MLPPSPLERSESVPAAARCASHDDRPALSVCARCEAFACASCTRVLASGESICVACEEPAVSSFPWERRAELGLARALALTVKGVLLSPAAFFAQRSREQALWPTLLLGMAFHVFGALGQMVVNLAFGDRIRADLAEDPIASKMRWIASDELFIAEGVLSPLTFVLATFFLASLWWIGLRAVGGLRRPFHVIVRALCYVQAVSVLVPWIAPLAHLSPVGVVLGIVFGSWALALQIIAVSRMQGTTVARGVAAFLVLMAIAGCIACLASMGTLWALASQIRIPNV